MNRFAKPKCSVSMILLCTILLYFSSACISPVTAEESKTMTIDVDQFVTSKQNFTVSVYDANVTNETLTPYLVGVTLFFNNNTFSIPLSDEDGEISITAPTVQQNTSYTLIAQKQGYQNATATIFVTPSHPPTTQRLIIIPEQFTVDAEKQFTVTVYDETGKPIAEATVGIQNDIGESSVTTTNEDGRACLIAPNKEKIILIAQKQGYQDGTEKIWVNTNPGFINTLLKNPYTMIIIAGIILLTVILYVGLVSRKHPISYTKHPENTYQYKNNQKNSINHQDISTVQHPPKARQPRVEEIRISRKDPDKKIVSLHHKTKNKRTTLSNNKKNTDIWYQGNQDLHRTIHKITGSNEKIKEDTWFQGTDDIQKKIDKALKEKDKKDKEE